MLNNVYFLKCLFLLPPTQVERKFDLMGSASRMMLEILTFQFHYGKEDRRGCEEGDQMYLRFLKHDKP